MDVATYPFTPRPKLTENQKKAILDETDNIGFKYDDGDSDYDPNRDDDVDCYCGD